MLINSGRIRQNSGLQLLKSGDSSYEKEQLLKSGDSSYEKESDALDRGWHATIQMQQAQILQIDRERAELGGRKTSGVETTSGASTTPRRS